MLVIFVVRLSKQLNLPHFAHTSLKSTLTASLHDFHVLKELSPLLRILRFPDSLPEIQKCLRTCHYSRRLEEVSYQRITQIGSWKTRWWHVDSWQTRSASLCVCITTGPEAFGLICYHLFLGSGLTLTQLFALMKRSIPLPTKQLRLLLELSLNKVPQLSLPPHWIYLMTLLTPFTYMPYQNS